MKALSIQQPWAWAVLYAGKPIENRTWRTHHRGPLLIHAGKTYDWGGRQFIEEVLDIRVPTNLPRGGIVGQADLVDCVDGSISPWFFGPYGFLLANPRPLPFVSLRGQLGLFEVPEHVFATEVA